MKTGNLKAPSPSPRISPSQSRWRRQWEGFKEFGFEHVLRDICMFLPKQIFDYNHANMYVAPNLSVEAPMSGEYQVRFATKADVDALVTMGVGRENFLSRLNRGDKCAIVTNKEQVVCMNWAAIVPVFTPLTGQVLKIGPTDVYFYHLLTVPEHRGKGLSRVIYKIQSDYHRSRGRNVVYAGVETFNTVSIVLHEKFGFSRCGETIKITFLGLSLCWYKSWPHPTRRFHFFIRPPANIEQA